MRIRVEKDKCCGAGHCVLQAPSVFDQDDDGVVVLLRDNPTGDEAGQALEAAEMCPTWAIRVVTDHQDATV